MPGERAAGNCAGTPVATRPSDVGSAAPWGLVQNCRLLPAGTGHQCLHASADLLVVGAYPPDGDYDLCRGAPGEHRKALVSIARVPLPASDPLYGAHGPLTRLWRA